MLNFYILIGAMLLMFIGLAGVEENAKLWKIIVYSIFGAALWPLLLIIAIGVSIVREVQFLYQRSKNNEHDSSPYCNYDDNASSTAAGAESISDSEKEVV